MAVTRLYTPRPYDSFDPAIAGVSPILATGTDVDNTKLTAVQAAAVAAGLGTLPTSAGGTAPTPVAEPLRFRGAWQASTVYSYGDVVINAGVQYVAPTSFTSGGSFVSANWTRLGTYDGTDPGLNAAYLVVLGPSNGTDDSATLQAALTAARVAGGAWRIVGKPGENYKVSSESIIGSGTVLDLSGCTVTVNSGTNVHFLRNYSEKNPVATAADGAVTSGSNVVTTALASQAVVGQTLIVAGAGGNGNGPLVGKISAVGGGTVTLKTLDGRACNATATVSSAAVTLVNRDSNITVRIGTLANGNNSIASPGYGVIFLRHIDGCVVDVQNYTSSGVSRGVGFGDCRDITITMPQANTSSVAVQGNGPLDHVHLVNVGGSSGDDLVAFTAGDYTAQQSTAGDITNVRVGTVRGDVVATNVFKLIAGAGWLIDAVKVYGQITCNGSTTGVFVGDDISNVSTTGGTYGDIDLGLVAGQVVNYLIGLVAPAAKRIKAQVRHTPSTASQPAVSIGGSSVVTIDTLELTGSTSALSKALIQLNAQASVVKLNRIILSDSLAGHRQSRPTDIAAARLPVYPFVLGEAWARADAASLGNVESSGAAWTVWSGVPGIASKQAYPTTSANTKAVTTAIADGYFEMVLLAVPTNGEAWLVFRGTDTSNYWRFGYASGTPSQINLQRVQSGSVTAVGAGGTIQQVDFYAGMRLGVLASAGNLTCYVDDVQVGSYTGASFNQTASLNGWQASDTAARFGPLSARSLVNAA